jgi:hypothetical protein
MATRKPPKATAALPEDATEASVRSPDAGGEFPPSEAAEAVAGADAGTVVAGEEPSSEEAAAPATALAHAAEKPAAGAARFHFFIIDAGWKTESAKVLRENFPMIRQFQDNDPLYVLTRAQSVALIRANPDLIGKDPILLVHDLQARGGRGESGYHGFRLCLGLLKDGPQALAAMQKFLRFVHRHRHSENIETAIREQLHRKGLEGAIEVLREGASALIE